MNYQYLMLPFFRSFRLSVAIIVRKKCCVSVQGANPVTTYVSRAVDHNGPWCHSSKPDADLSHLEHDIQLFSNVISIVGHGPHLFQVEQNDMKVVA